MPPCPTAAGQPQSVMRILVRDDPSNSPAADSYEPPRHNVDAVFADPVHDVVRKRLTRSCRLGSRVAHGVPMSWCSNQLDRLTDRIEQFSAQIRSLLLVPADRVVQFDGGRIAELKRLHRPSRSFSIRCFTCSQGSNGAKGHACRDADSYSSSTDVVVARAGPNGRGDVTSVMTRTASITQATLVATGIRGGCNREHG